MTVKEWEQTKAYKLMYDIELTIWIPWSSMTKEEQEKNQKLELLEGYTKSIPLKDAWANAWNNWTEESRKEFTSLENFDATIFEKITGIKI
jgi:Ser/Thr protein kinase RdoA (MazF antagonist)